MQGLNFEVPEWEDAGDGWGGAPAAAEKAVAGSKAAERRKNRKKRKREEQEAGGGSAGAAAEAQATKGKRRRVDEGEEEAQHAAAPPPPLSRRQRKKQRQIVREQARAAAASSPAASPPPSPSVSAERETEEEREAREAALRGRAGAGGRMALPAKLKGARFRWLNEELYTSDSSAALELFSKEPELFDAYHEGFREQVKAWPTNPVDVMVAHVRTLGRKAVVGDFGCGDAMLAAAVPNVVHSFDLVAPNPRVTACDIAHVPIDDEVLDVAVFSLSLMGTNYLDFLAEAHRTLKPGGLLKVAEVKSRIDNIGKFVRTLQGLGFRLEHKDDANTMFILFDFRKAARKPGKESPAYALKPCLYKRR